MGPNDEYRHLVEAAERAVADATHKRALLDAATLRLHEARRLNAPMNMLLDFQRMVFQRNVEYNEAYRLAASLVARANRKPGT